MKMRFYDTEDELTLEKLKEMVNESLRNCKYTIKNNVLYMELLSKSLPNGRDPLNEIDFQRKYTSWYGNKSKNDNGNINPSHYKNGPNNKEVIDIMIDIWGKEKVIYYCEMNAFKYRMRAGKKSDLITEDIEKALWYENKIKELKNN